MGLVNFESSNLTPSNISTMLEIVEQEGSREHAFQTCAHPRRMEDPCFGLLLELRRNQTMPAPARRAGGDSQLEFDRQV